MTPRFMHACRYGAGGTVVVSRVEGYNRQVEREAFLKCISLKKKRMVHEALRINPVMSSPHRRRCPMSLFTGRGLVASARPLVCQIGG